MYCKRNYRDDKKYKDYRNRGKRAYRARTDFADAESKYRRYTDEEKEMIMAQDIPDRILAEILKRSVPNIQTRRAQWRRHDKSRGV